ncbi:MAG: extracellular solute-binding protein [Clostridia bacterium]|nr:extracellular solute-binding protein [Clostridia bacterium]
MKKLIATFLAAASVLLIASLGSCGKRAGLVYPDEGYADDKSDSWLQLDKNAEEYTIDWFVNFASYGNAAQKGTLVAERIYEKTKCRINFITPITDDGAQFSTMVAGNKLPDVVTVGASSEESLQLAMDGYTYPIQTLAEKYAPSLLARLDPDIKAAFKMSDGNIYGLPNHFYTESDMAAYREQEGKGLNSNGAMVVRRDYLDQYTRTFPTRDVTTASGFLEMCKWVKTRYKLTDSNPTFMLDTFSSKGSNGITWLMEYFAVPSEDKNGNLLNAYEQENYRDGLMFLNTLYREKLISPANFTAQYGTLSAYLQQGMPFAFIGSPQLYTASFANAYKNGIEYVPVVITNDKKETPLLTDLSGNGWQFSMITSNCKHPDRVIKLFDYLYSDEGQSLFFGVEGETFTYEIEPGATVNGKVYKYGKIRWSDEVDEDIISGSVAQYGFMYSNVFVNPMYPRLASPDGAVLNGFNDYIDWNIKAAISDYTYASKGFAYVSDVSDPDYKEMYNISTKIANEWGTYLPQIISATSGEEAMNMYESVVASCKRLGSDRLLAFNDKSFKEYKNKIGIKFAWPANDPESGYSSLKVTNIRGNTDYNLEIPEKYMD